MLMNPIYSEEDLKVTPSHRPVDTVRRRFRFSVPTPRSAAAWNQARLTADARAAPRMQIRDKIAFNLVSFARYFFDKVPARSCLRSGRIRMRNTGT
jgi:hypothetical protein